VNSEKLPKSKRPKGGHGICPENTPHPNPLPQGERGVICDLPFVSPPLMGGERGAGEIFSCLFVPINLHESLIGFDSTIGVPILSERE